MYKKAAIAILLVLILLTMQLSIAPAQDGPRSTPPPPDGNGPPPRGNGNPPPNDGNSGNTSADISDDIIQVELNITDYETFGDALSAQIEAGDGNGIDNYFRNSGVVIDDEAGAYYAVNGVHPVEQGDYTSYYPKSIVMASLEDDTILRTYTFSGINDHDVDMEGLTFAESNEFLYIGDEYNLIYELELDSGTITREWDLADVDVSTNIDKGIEAITYSHQTGYFYVGIQDLGNIITLDLSLDEGETLTKVDEFQLLQGWSPSGLFAHTDGTLYVVSMSGGGQAGGQMIFRYQTDGTLLCALTIPSQLNITRPDGIYIDNADEYIYIVDSQGPIYGGFSLYKIAWDDLCN